MDYLETYSKKRVTNSNKMKRSFRIEKSKFSIGKSFTSPTIFLFILI